MRRENYSIDGKARETTGWGISNFLSILDESNKRIKCETILVDKDGPHEEEAKLLAKHINKLKEEKNCKKIHILGVSKGGCIVTATLKYLRDSNLNKLNVIAYQAPFLGTIFASPRLLYKKLDELVGSISDSLLKRLIPSLQKIRPKTKKENQSNNLLKALKTIHWNVFSQSHMDYDISIVDKKGVPTKHLNRYDRNFLASMFNEETLARLKQVNFTNITTNCSEKTLTRALETRNINAIMLYLSSKTIFKGKISDGMVDEKSSKYIEEICDKNEIKISKTKIPNGHHDIASDINIINQVMKENVLKNEPKVHDSR